MRTGIDIVFVRLVGVMRFGRFCSIRCGGECWCWRFIGVVVGVKVGGFVGYTFSVRVFHESGGIVLWLIYRASRWTDGRGCGGLAFGEEIQDGLVQCGGEAVVDAFGDIGGGGRGRRTGFGYYVKVAVRRGLGDCLIRILDFLGSTDEGALPSAGKLLVEIMTENERRPEKHGKEF